MTFLTVVFVLGPYCADQGGVVFLLTESSMLYHHLLNPLCAFVSFVLLEREPKLPARCVPLALVPTMLYGSVASGPITSGSSPGLTRSCWSISRPPGRRCCGVRPSWP